MKLLKLSANKNLIILLLVASVSILLSGNIEYWSAKYSLADQIYYRQMAESAPLLNFNIPHFFAYRILPPWLAGILPGNIPTGFHVLNFIFLLLLTYSFYFLLIKLGLKEKTALILSFIFVFNRYFFQMQAWNYFQLVDIMSNTIIFCLLIALISARYLLLAILFLIGVLCKETVLVIIPVSIVWFYRTGKIKNEYWKIITFSLPSVILFFILRSLITSLGNENLLTQSIEESYKYLNPFVWIKVVVIPFLPFSLLPVIFYKEFIEFVKSKLFLVTLYLLVILTAILGYDFERLIAPASPSFYFFVGIIIEKYVNPENLKSQMFIAAILLLSFVNSFYHLWGIIRLSDANATIISSALILFLVSALFIYIRKKSDSSSESFS